MNTILFLIGLVTSTLWIPLLESPAELPRWQALTLLVAVGLVVSDRGRKINTVDLLLLLPISLAALSLMWTPNIRDGLGALFNLVTVAFCYVIGRRVEDLGPLIAGACIGIGVSSALVLIEKFGGVRLVPGVTTHPPGLFVNSLALAGAALLAAVGAATHRMWWGFLLVMPSLVWSNGKAAMLALLVCVVTMAWSVSRWVGALLGAAGALAIAGFAITGRDRSSIAERWDIYRATLSGLRPFGNGLGSFRDQFPLLTDSIDTLRSRVEHAHSDWLHLSFEAGLVPVACTLIACTLAFRVARHTRYARTAWIVVAGTAAMVFSLNLHNPLAMALFACALGHTARAYSPDLCRPAGRQPHGQHGAGAAGRAGGADAAPSRRL